MAAQEEVLYGGIVDAGLPHNFKKYVQAEFYCLEKNGSRVFWSRNDGRPELRPNHVGDCWDFIYRTSRDSTNEKIRAVFMDFLRSYFNSGHPYLVQFWAKEEGRSFLTTQHLPFALHDSAYLKSREEIQGLCEYRMICKEHICYLDLWNMDNVIQQQQQQKHGLLEGIPGRVFRNQSPEFSPNVEYYSPTEYPHLQDALRCQVRSSFAFPVFEPSGQTCLGVVELLSTTKDAYLYGFLHMLPDALKDVGLCSVESLDHYYEQAMLETHQAAWKEILKVQEVVLEVYKLRLAQIWVPCRTCSALVGSRDCTRLMSLIKLEKHTFMDDDDDDDDNDDDDDSDNKDAGSFSRVCNYFHLRKGCGIVGRAFLYCSLIYCTDVTQFSLAEYSLSHYARQYGFSGCFAICLQSSFTGNDAFVLEFFFPKSFKDNGDPWTSLKEILQKMRENCQYLKLGSGAELTEELPIEVIDFQNGEKLQYVSSLHELLKNGGMKQMVSSGQQSNDSSDQQYAIKPSNINVTGSEEKGTGRKAPGGGRKALDSFFSERVNIGFAKYEWRMVDTVIFRDVVKLQFPPLPSGIELPPLTSDAPSGKAVPQLTSDAPSGIALASVAQTGPQDMMMQDADNVTIKVKYGNDIIKFQLSSSAGMVELQHEVDLRLKLEGETYCMKYKGEDNNLVSITCDQDLQYFIRTYRSQCATSLVIFLDIA